MADIVPFLSTQNDKYDLLIAGDVLVYFGALNELMSAASNALNPAGFFVFNTEISVVKNFILNPSGRFAHRQQYVTELAEINHFKIKTVLQTVLRTQDNKPVNGLIYVLQKEGN